jgi:predicted acetyltransferase
MTLIKPCMTYQDSYFGYIAELGNEERYPFPLDFDCTDFQRMLDKVDDFANGVDLPSGYVPSSTFWLIDANELIGVTNMRHHLNHAIEHCGGHIGLGIRPSYRGQGFGNLLMKLSIEWLFQRGVDPVHIHCYKNNPASANTIIANGGTLHSELDLDHQVVQRFLVTEESLKARVNA